jgi:hypothetical protein
MSINKFLVSTKPSNRQPVFRMILVFKTTICCLREVQMVKPYLDAMSPIHTWNVDLQDCDYVLRIQSSSDVSLQVIRLVQALGYVCTELC